MCKKSALDLACEELEKNEVFSIVMCEICPDKDKCHLCKGPAPTSAKIGRSYFVNHADIPDGGEVVKEIYNQIETIRMSGDTSNFRKLLKRLSEKTKNKLKQAGMEE